METRIWFEDLSNFLFNKDTLLNFVPDGSNSLVENLNAFMRFSIYFTAIIVLIKRDVNIILFLFIVGVVTVAIYVTEKQKNEKKMELFTKLNINDDAMTKSVCYKPTKENPFMNVTFLDRTEFPSRPKACDITRNSVKKTVQNYFDDGLYRDVDDIFNRKASDRQFYTMPSTTIPNDQSGFASWCFKTDKTCKERTSKCNVS